MPDAGEAEFLSSLSDEVMEPEVVLSGVGVVPASTSTMGGLNRLNRSWCTNCNAHRAASHYGGYCTMINAVACHLHDIVAERSQMPHQAANSRT
jgi:hypothetical protein